MKPRDLALVAAVVLVGGFALADALRGRGGERAEPTTETRRGDRDGPRPRPDAPEDWPFGRTRGTLVFSDADDCRIRVIGLAGGRERPEPGLVGTCRFWAAPVGQRLAYALGDRFSGTDRFVFVNLGAPSRDLGAFNALFGPVIWSPDGQRAAWCERSGAGYELETGTQRPRRLARCPLTYAPDGRLAFALGRRLVSDGRTLLTERAPIRRASWGEDGSLLVVLAGGTVRRYDPRGRVDSTVVSTDVDVVPAPDNCAVLSKERRRIQLADVGCFEGGPRVFLAHDAAWSPDGHWVAVAEPTQITFEQVVGRGDTLVWPARARELYWRGD